MIRVELGLVVVMYHREDNDENLVRSLMALDLGSTRCFMVASMKEKRYRFRSHDPARTGGNRTRGPSHSLERRSSIDKHAGLKVTSTQDGKRSQDDDKRLYLADDLKEAQNHMQVKLKGTSSSLKSKDRYAYHKLKDKDSRPRAKTKDIHRM
ncbi:hypothetical protein Tco_1531293 [Tanacetum coccineum]